MCFPASGIAVGGEGGGDGGGGRPTLGILSQGRRLSTRGFAICRVFFFRPRSPAGESMRRIYIIIMKIASQGAPRTGLTLRRTARSPWTRVRVSAECSRVVDFIGIAILPPSIYVYSRLIRLGSRFRLAFLRCA